MVFSVSSVLVSSAHQFAIDYPCCSHQPLLPNSSSETVSAVRCVLPAGRNDLLTLKWRNLTAEDENAHHRTGRLSIYRLAGKTGVCTCRAKWRGDRDGGAGEPLRQQPLRRHRKGPETVAATGGALKEKEKSGGLEPDDSVNDLLPTRSWDATGPGEDGSLIDKNSGSTAEFRVSPGEADGRSDWEWPDSDGDMSSQPSTSGKSFEPGEEQAEKRFRMRNGRQVDYIFVKQAAQRFLFCVVSCQLSTADTSVLNIIVMDHSLSDL